jgi:hypothetical protein
MNNIAEKKSKINEEDSSVPIALEGVARLDNHKKAMLKVYDFLHHAASSFMKIFQ